MRRIIYSILLVMAVLTNAKAYDFSAACSTGQTLYYNIISASTAELCGCQAGASGNIVIPGSVDYNGNTYTVTEIGTKAFEWFSALTGALTIPSSVTTIGNYAFRGCTGFNGALTLPASLTSLGDHAFDGCTGITGALDLPEALTTLGNGAFYNCSGLTGDVVIPSGITVLNGQVFRGCTGLNGTLTLPANLTTIKEYAFRGCSALHGELTIPSKVTSIEQKAFKDCSGFTGTLVLPNLTTLGNEAFYGCSGLTGSLEIPGTLTAIEINTFMGCSGLDGQLTIPQKVTEIKSGAFSGCTSISAMKIQAFGTIPTITATSLEGISNDTPLYVFCGMAATFSADANWSRFNNVTEDYVFVVDAIPNNDTLGSTEIIEAPSCGNYSIFTAKATPREGYYLEKWTIQGKTLSVGTDLTYTDTVRENRILVANFKQKTQSVIAVSVFPAASGTVKINNSNTNPMNVNFDANVTLTATASSGYVFKHWLEADTIVSTETTYTFTSNGDRTFIACFNKQHPEITATAEPEGGATFEGTGTYNEGETVTLTAVPKNDNYIFVCWKDEDMAAFAFEPTITFTAEIDRHFTALLYSLVDVDENNASINIFPNPTNGTFTITGNGVENVLIYNTVGQLVRAERAEGTEVQTIDLTDQSNGIYIIQIVTSNGTLTKKIVKE